MKLTSREKHHIHLSVQFIEGWLSNHEAYLLYLLAKEGNGSGEIVEIGSFKGKSTIALGLGLTRTKRKGYVWAIDPHEGIIKNGKGSTHGETLTDFKRNIKDAGLRDIVKPLISFSKDAASEWSMPIRLLFLDGLHDYEHTEEDYRLWRKHISNGIIAFHDGFCGEEGVGKVIKKHAFADPDIVDIGTVTSILYLILGKPTVYTRVRVMFKKNIILFATAFNSIAIPWAVKRFIIHGLCRLLLITSYTRAIY